MERIICLSSQYPKPGFRHGAGSSRVSYLALHPKGFSEPPRLLEERWAFTPPFHPYPNSEESGRFNFLWHYPSDLHLPACICLRSYAASRPVEFGLSSSDFRQKRFSTSQNRGPQHNGHDRECKGSLIFSIFLKWDRVTLKNGLKNEGGNAWGFGVPPSGGKARQIQRLFTLKAHHRATAPPAEAVVICP